MKNGLWTKWIFIVGHVFFCLMSGCTSTRFYPEPTNHQPLAFMGSEQVWQFLKVDTGQHFLDKAPWMLPNLDDIFSKSIHDVQSEFEMLDWQINQLIISLSDMIQEIDSHQKGRLQSNRTKLESSHDATREQGKLWVGSKGGSTFGATSDSCNEVRELFQNFGNPNRYRPTKSEESSSVEHSQTTTTVSIDAANIYSPASIAASSIFQSNDIQPTPSLFTNTRASDFVGLQSTFSAHASDSENLDPFEHNSSPRAESAVTHFDFSSGNHFSTAGTPLATSTPFKDASTHIPNELFSSLGVATTPVVPFPSEFVSDNAHTIRSSYFDMTADQKSLNSPARTVTSEALGPFSSWHAMDSYYDPSFHSASTSARSALVTPTNVGEMTRSSVAIVSQYEASTQAVTSPISSSPPTVSTPSVSANEWASQLHSSQVAPQTQSQNAAHSLDVPSQPINSASSLTSSFIGTTVDAGNLLASRTLESSLKDPWTSIVGTSTLIPLVGSLTPTLASADLKITTSLTPSWIETYSESRVVPSTQEEVVRTSFDTKLQSSGLVSATIQTVQQVSVATSFGSSFYSIEQNSAPGFTQTANVFSNTLLSSSRFLFPTLTLTDTNLMSGNLVSGTAATIEQSATTQPTQQVSVVTSVASSKDGAEQNSVPGFTQTANIFSSTLLSSGTFRFPTVTDTNLMSGNLVSGTAATKEQSATTQPTQQVSVVTSVASSTDGAEHTSVPGFTQVTNDFSSTLLSSNTFHFPLTDTSLLSANLVSASPEIVAQSSMKPFGSSKYSIEQNSLEDFTKITNAFSDSLLSSTTFHVPLNDIITNTPTPNTVWSVALSAQTVRELPTITSFPSSTSDYAATSKFSYDSSQTVQLSSGLYSTTNLGGATVVRSSMLTPSPASIYSSNLASWTSQANMDSQGRSQAVSSGISVVSSTGIGTIFSTLAPALGSTGVAEVLPASKTSFTSITPYSSTRVTQADSVTSSFGSTASRNPSSTLSPSTVQPSGLTLVMTSSKTSNTGNWASCSEGQVTCESSSSEIRKTSLTTNLLSTSSAAAPSTHLSAAASEADQRTTAAAQSTVHSTPLFPSASFTDASTALSDNTTIFTSSASVFSNTSASTNSLTNKGGKTALVSLSQLLILLAVNVFSAVTYCSY